MIPFLLLKWYKSNELPEQYMNFDWVWQNKALLRLDVHGWDTKYDLYIIIRLRLQTALRSL